MKRESENLDIRKRRGRRKRDEERRRNKHRVD